MKRSPEDWRPTRGLSNREQGDARLIVMVLIFFLLGVGTGAFWIWHSKSTIASKTPDVGRPLFDRTTAVLDKLGSPVEIRFYSLLDPSNAPASLQAYAARVDRLLAEYERAGSNKITVKRYHFEPNSPLQNAALADGIKPFDINKGEGSFFGIAVERNGQKESLPYLSPDWEQALEFDLTRAINRTADSSQAQSTPPLTSSDPAAIAAVKSAIPNLDSVSLEDGTRILRDAAVQQFAQAAQEMDAQIKQAEQRLAQARTSQSAADQDAAIQQLQQLQADQSEKLRAIAAQCQAQVDALKSLKSAPR
jgi:hypothetical protein